MFRVRVTLSKVGSRSVQIVRYADGKRYIVKHIGSGHTDEELAALKKIALTHIEELSRQYPLFTDLKSARDVVMLSQCEYHGFYYTFLYEILYAIQGKLGYTVVADEMLNDLTIMRILEPSSKLRSIELMESYFGIRHRRQRY